MSDFLRASDRALERLSKLHPKSIDLTLGRTERLLAALGAPERRLPPIVHVAGTNGKGSTIAVLRAITEAAGLKTHVFTSPHLVRLAERIRLAGTLIGDQALHDLLERVEAANAGQPITFFEITAAAALLAFSETPADVLLLEVGLGGRYDATNVIPGPAVSVITPIDHDHREFLGTTLAEIASAKAGILKPGVPAVVAFQDSEALAVIEAEAEAVGARLILQGRDFDAHQERGRLVVQFGDRLYDLPPPGLAGAHQYANAGLAVVAALALGRAEIDADAISKGVFTAAWPGRLQRLSAGPLSDLAQARGADLWLDGAHNPHGAQALARFAAGLKARDGRPVTLIVGLLANKDWAGVFEALAPIRPRIVTTGFDAPTAADPAQLAEAARDVGLEAQAAPNVTAALNLALAAEGPAPHVLIAGSLYLAGEVLSLSPETTPS
jgi:dihydrofolate synthase/folylpolyglutamate synthase